MNAGHQAGLPQNHRDWRLAFDVSPPLAPDWGPQELTTLSLDGDGLEQGSPA